MRRRRPEKRIINPDPFYGDLVVAKFVNNLMRDGKKSVAEKIVYSAFSLIEKKEKTDLPIDIFKKALKNVAPMVEVKSRRIGGATYQVPIEIPENRYGRKMQMQFLAIHQVGLVDFWGQTF